MTRRIPSPVHLLLTLTLVAVPLRARGGDGPKNPRPGDPVLSFDLEDLGFEAPAPRFLVGGITMYSVHFVDSTHILLTFNTHGLIPRMQDSLPDDEDRLVSALLLELPSGNVVARTTWHTRDREQYLWPLTHGLFLLRIRSRLTVIDPLRNLATGDAFRQQTFLDMGRRIGYISVAPSGDLLIVETVPSRHPEADENAGTVAAAQVPPSQPGAQPRSLPDPARVSALDSSFAVQTGSLVQIHFFRLLFEPRDAGGMHLIAQAAGLVTSQNLIRVPATSDGFLDILKESPQTWDFDFQSHAGKRVELAPFDTTCAPSPYFISRSEFVAFGCRGADSHLTFSGFNFRGEQPWIQTLSGQQIAPFIVAAPAAGRFAFSRILVGSSFYDVNNLAPEEMTSQEILVFQHYDGRVLLKVQASPIQRTGQNFDLSSDGLSFALIRNGNLEIYHLPALSSKDEAQLKLAAADIPEPNDARIRLASTRPPAPAGNKPSAAPTKALVISANGTVTPPLAPQSAPPIADAPIPSNPVDIVNALALPDTPGSGSAPAPAPTAVSTPQPAPAPEPEAPRPPPSLYTPDYPKPAPHL